MSVPVTLSDPEPGFKDHCILKQSAYAVITEISTIFVYVNHRHLSNNLEFVSNVIFYSF